DCGEQRRPDADDQGQAGTVEHDREDVTSEVAGRTHRMLQGGWTAGRAQALRVARAVRDLLRDVVDVERDEKRADHGDRDDGQEEDGPEDRQLVALEAPPRDLPLIE